MNNLKFFLWYLVAKSKTCKTLSLQILIDVSHEFTIQKLVQRVADCSIVSPIVNFSFFFFSFVRSDFELYLFVMGRYQNSEQIVYVVHNSSNTCSFGTFDKNLIYIPKETWKSEYGVKKFLKLNWNVNPTRS